MKDLRLEYIFSFFLALSCFSCGKVGTLKVKELVALVEVDLCEDYKSVTAIDGVGGDGTSTDTPYLICTAAQLDAIGQDETYWDKHFYQLGDIDMAAFTGSDFNIIGLDTDNLSTTHQGTKFSGSYDGANNTISNFTYTTTDEHYVGIFGAVEGGGSTEIKNIVMENVTISAPNSEYVGGLIAKVFDTNDTVAVEVISISNVTITASKQIGGVVGVFENTGGTLDTLSVVTGTLTSATTNNVLMGGVIGHLIVGTSIKLHSDVTVDGTDDDSAHIGGLIGQADGGTSYQNCYSLGATSGGADTGGLVGQHSGEMSKCYSYGAVTDRDTLSGGDTVHPALGNDSGIESNCYYNNSAGSSCNNCATDSCNGITATAMESAASYSGFDNAYWNFDGDYAVFKYPSTKNP